MRLTRRFLPVFLFIAVGALVVGPPVVLISNAVSTGPSPGVAPSAASGSADSSGTIESSTPAAAPPPAPTVQPPSTGGDVLAGAQPLRLTVPQLYVIAPRQLTADQLSSVGRLAGVRAVLPVDGGQVSLNGRSAAVLGVPAAQFRAWTPPATAAATGIWAALANGGLVATYDAASRLGLTLGSSYLSLPFTGIAPSGVPGIDVIVDHQRSAQLGLVPDIALLISAPGANYAALIARLHTVIGASAHVVNLVPLVAQQPATSLPVASASPGLPTSWLQLYKDSAALYCPGLSWTVLAAIGQIESGHGTNDGPSSAGALGPMQFLPSTWAEWGIAGFGRNGPPDIMSPFDAVPSAARMLCADGATKGSAGLSAAIWDYNHADWYVTEVLQLAEEYAHDYP